MKFVHLHLHTEYSLIDSLVRIEPLVAETHRQAMPAVAVTDHTNLFALVKVYQEALAKGIKPIIGAEVWLVNAADATRPFCLVLLCQNAEGYKNLSILLTKAYQHRVSATQTWIQYEWLPGHTAGLIALSGAAQGDIGQALLQGDEVLAKQRLLQWERHFSKRFYLELQRLGREREEEYIQAALHLAEVHQVPVVATNDVRFLEPDEFEAHEARVCIHEGYVLGDTRRPKKYTGQQYFRSSEEMIELFSDVPSAIENTVAIAKRCNLILTLGKNFLPIFPVPEGMNEGDYLSARAHEGLKEQLAVVYKERLTAEITRQYQDRLNLEIGVIKAMGFPGYFLIVADFIQWAKDNGIPVGPGRGSGAGSLAAYALKITGLDPLQFDLLFERFLNPERVSMPDFDIDFCMEGRDRVIDYVTQKYGRGSVSQIITFGTMAAKAVVRDVGRVLDFPYGFVDKIAKLIPFELGMTLSKAMEEPALRERYESEDEVKTIIDLAMQLEGLSRNAGKHAGGVVIAPGKLTDFVPLYCEAGTQHYVTQLDKDDVESIGLVKFDFLGLRTLTIIDWAVQTINANLANKTVDINRIPLEDPEPFKLLKRCETTAVFQLESRGMKDLIKRLQPDCFEDIIALVALFRPGPLQSGMVDDFINRKHGRSVIVYPHPKLEPILKPTYGVILYQEQVMQIAQVLAGYSLGAADILRRAMGKKKPEEMAQQREFFTKGALENGVDEKTATGIFDLMEKFAGYGFNKSHSAAYALVAYQTAWLKTYYPSEFMAAVLSSDMDNTDKVVIFIEECKAMNLTVLPPAINQGHIKFTVDSLGQIIYGLGAIKGVGEAALDNIIVERETRGLFNDLFDFCCRIDGRKVTKRVLEALVKSGAMDTLGPCRSTLYASLGGMQQAAEQLQKNQEKNQSDLFGLSEAVTQQLTPEFTEGERWSARQRLQFEKETLGYYLSGHPFLEYEQEVRQFASTALGSIQHAIGNTVTMAGLIVGLRRVKTKRGKLIVIIALDDCSGKVDVTLFSEVYERAKEVVVPGELVVVEGDVAHDEFTGGARVVAKRVWSLTMARHQFAKRLFLALPATKMQNGLGKQIAELLSRYRGGTCPVHLCYQHDEGKALLPLGQEWKISPVEELIESLQALLSPEAVRLDY